ncbi:MAG: MFS transporter [Solirubrobacteraceae bacterium]|nr:MFS transporter [Solirubrobacteraceae bacterium]
MRAAIETRAFRRALVAYIGDQIVDWAAMVALMLLVYRETGSALATALLLVCKTLAPAALVPILARRSEQFPVRVTAAAALTACGLTLAVMAASPLAALWPLVFVFELAALLARSAIRGSLPLCLHGDALRAGNALINAASALLAAIAPALAAVATVAVGPRAILLAGATAALLSAAAATALTSARPCDLPDEDDPGPASGTGLPDVATSTWVTLVAGTALLITLFSMDEPVLVAYVHESLGAGESTYGLVVSAWGLGMLAGSAAYLRIRHLDPSRLAIGFALVLSAGYMGLGIASTAALAITAAIVCGIANGVMFTAFVNAVQEAVPAGRQARAASWIEAIGAGGAGVGFLLGGALAALTDPRAPFLVGGVAGATVAVVLLGSLARQDNAATTRRRARAAP